MQHAEVVHQPIRDGTEVSLVKGLAAGLTVFLAGKVKLCVCIGAAIAGTSHFVGTAKKLEVEGITKAQRLQALPTAAKALSVATAVCVGVGTAGFFALRQLGIRAKERTEVSSVHGAISLAEEQRAFIRNEFQKRLHQWQKHDVEIAES